MLFIHNASEILTMKGGIGVVQDASLLIEHGIIKEIGSIKNLPKGITTIDATGRVVCPGFVDSHTHLVYGGSREDEFALRTAGETYERIAKAGGGIAQTVKMTRQATEDELYEQGMKRIQAVIRHGTTTIEIKSGYGLSTVEELKILRVIHRLKYDALIDIVPTYLVHAIPQHMKRRDYVDLVTEETIPEVARHKAAVFCDIFCDKVGFSRKESEKVLTRAQEFNFGLKIHADQFSNIGGARLAAKLGCVSAEHLEFTTQGAIKEMKKTGVIPVLLPGTTFYLNIKKKPDINAYRKTRSHVAIASDYNPGSCMIYAMPKIIAIACIQYGMHVEEALMGATKHAAQALNLHTTVGSIEEGKHADLVILSVDSYKKIPYQFGEDIVAYTIKKGRILYGENS